jgi:hypothetical protein
LKLPEVTYGGPAGFSRRQRIALVVFPPLVAWAIRGVCGACRFEVRGREHLESALREPGHFILALWHECMMLGSYHFAGMNIHTLASFSFDGEFGSRVISRLGSEAIRGSSSRGGAGGLRELEKALPLVPGVGLTLDGPRGPRRVAKPGAVILAARTRTPIVPIVFVPSAAWRLHSWDRLPVPKPLARVLCVYGPPIAPPPDDSRDAIEPARLNLETTLNDMHLRAENELGVSAG